MENAGPHELRLPPDPRQQSRREHHELHGVVRGDVLGVSRDPLRLRHRDDRGGLSRLHRGLRVLVRQPRRPPRQEERDAGLERHVIRILRDRSGLRANGPSRRLQSCLERMAVGVGVLRHARRDRGQPPLDRPSDPRDDPHSRRGTRQSERSRRHGDRDRIPDHLGHFRLPGGVWRHDRGPRPGSGPHACGVHSSGGGPDRGEAGRDNVRSPEGAKAGGYPRHHERYREGAGSFRPDLLRDLQQLPGGHLHGPARRLRSLPRFGGEVGAALRRALDRIHPQRPADLEVRPRGKAPARPAPRQPHQLVGGLRLHHPALDLAPGLRLFCLDVPRPLG